LRCRLQESHHACNQQNCIVCIHLRSILGRRRLPARPTAACGLYDLVLAEVEAPLLEVTLTYVQGNQSKAAELLGLNRGTLRKKLKQYDLL